MTRNRILFILSLLLIGSAVIWAAPKPPGQHLNVTEVSIDFVAEMLRITGEDFDFGGPIAVTLGEIGEITSLCALDVAALDAAFMAQRPKGRLPVPGSWIGRP